MTISDSNALTPFQVIPRLMHRMMNADRTWLESAPSQQNAGSMPPSNCNPIRNQRSFGMTWQGCVPRRPRVHEALNPHGWCSNSENDRRVHPHPGPLPRGEGETFPVSGETTTEFCRRISDFTKSTGGCSFCRREKVRLRGKRRVPGSPLRSKDKCENTL
jgi:hypothetical protein